VWTMTHCSLGGVYQCFGRIYRRHLPGINFDNTFLRKLCYKDQNVPQRINIFSTVISDEIKWLQHLETAPVNQILISCYVGIKRMAEDVRKVRQRDGTVLMLVTGAGHQRLCR
jgi:hypothetical protein